MPLLRNGQLLDNNPWVRLTDEDDTASAQTGEALSSPTLIGVGRFLKMSAAEQGLVSGLWIAPEDDVTELAGRLDQVQVIAIDFPAFTDGRGYSHARTLRTRFGFTGELRAVGDIRPDQLLFMRRAGIDTFEFDEAPDLELIDSIASRYTVNYQPSYALPIAG